MWVVKMVKIAFYTPNFLAKHEDQTELWIDFIRETALTYSAPLTVIGSDISPRYLLKNKIASVSDVSQIVGACVFLSANELAPSINSFIFPEDVTIIVGADDYATVIPAGASEVHIQTPDTYPLWSAVAAGIALHYAHLK